MKDILATFVCLNGLFVVKKKTDFIKYVFKQTNNSNNLLNSHVINECK